MAQATRMGRPRVYPSTVPEAAVSGRRPLDAATWTVTEGDRPGDAHPPVEQHARPAPARSGGSTSGRRAPSH